MSWFSGKVLNAVLAIAISLTLWVVVQLQAVPTDHEFSNVELELRGLPDGLIVVGEKKPMVKLVAKGPAELFKGIRAEDLKPFVDLSKEGPVKKAFTVRLDRAAKDKDRGIEWQLPSQTITIDSESYIDLPVRVIATGALLSPNQRYDDATVTPEKVRITGAAGLVKSVRTARVLLDLGTVHPGTVQTLDVELLDRQGSPVQELAIEPRSVKVGPVITPAEQRRLLFVNVIFEGTQPDPGFRVTRVRVVPAQVRVDGSSLGLARLRSSTIDTRRIDLTGLRQTTTFQVELDANGLRGMKPEVSTVQVTVEIDPVSSKSILP